MPLPNTLVRVTKAAPCPICKKPDWCVVARDESVAFCCRTDYGSVRYCEKLCAWEFKLDGNRIDRVIAANKVVRNRTATPEPEIDAAKLNAEYQMDLADAQIETLCESLGIEEVGLGMLGLGYSKSHHSYTFPMRNVRERVVGIRLRNLEGRKWAVCGSRNGLFMPEGFDPIGDVYICEGPTDTAAALGEGLDAIGRSSCRGEVADIVKLFRRLKRRAIIVSDNDGPGESGARELADQLSTVTETRIIYPLAAKDMREWIVKGATNKLIECVAANAKPWKRTSKDTNAPYG